jgi:hypothetical protein
MNFSNISFFHMIVNYWTDPLIFYIKMPQLEDLFNLTDINFVSLSDFDLIVIIEMILIMISLGVPVIAFRMLMVSGLIHIHLKSLLLIAYVFFILCMLSRIVITIGILLRLDYSGRKFCN